MNRTKREEKKMKRLGEKYRFTSQEDKEKFPENMKKIVIYIDMNTGVVFTKHREELEMFAYMMQSKHGLYGGQKNAELH